MAALIKDEGQVSDWQVLDDTGADPSGESAVITTATALSKLIVVTIAHKDVNDAGSNFVKVKLMGKTGAATEDWKKIEELQAGGGQALTEALDAASASGQKQIKVAATTDWDLTDIGKRLLLHNVGSEITSEIVTISDLVGADYYLAHENLSNSHDAGDGDALFDGVDEIVFQLPSEFETTKVLVHNTDTAANYLWRVDFAEVSSIG